MRAPQIAATGGPIEPMSLWIQRRGGDHFAARQGLRGQGDPRPDFQSLIADYRHEAKTMQSSSTRFRDDGKQIGIQLREANVLLLLLEHKFGPVADDVRQRVEQADPDRLCDGRSTYWPARRLGAPAACRPAATRTLPKRPRRWPAERISGRPGHRMSATLTVATDLSRTQRW